MRNQKKIRLENGRKQIQIRILQKDDRQEK